MNSIEQNNFAILEEFKNETFHLFLRSDGIVQMDTHDDAFFTIKEANEFLEALAKITKSVPHLIIKNPGKHASVDTESRKFMATEEALQYSIAEAVIIKNVAQRMIGNFYVKFDKPQKPIHLFGTVEDAVVWLKSL